MSDKIILLAQEEVTRKTPVDPNYQKELFSGELQKTLDETYLIHLDRCQVLSHGFLLRRFSFLPKSETFYSVSSPLKVLKIIVKVILANLMYRVKMVETEPVLFITDEFSNGYFHWIADCLPKLEALEQVKGKDFLKDYVLVVLAMADFPYLKRSLEPFVFKKIIILKKMKEFSATIYLISAPWLPRETIALR